jgi:hypothetical protein
MTSYPQYAIGNACSGRGFLGRHIAATLFKQERPGDPTYKCPLDLDFIVYKKYYYIDQQTLKLQEAPDQVPVRPLLHQSNRTRLEIYDHLYKRRVAGVGKFSIG